MSQFKQDLIKARSAIIFLIGLSLAFALVFTIERWKLTKIVQVTTVNNLGPTEADPTLRQQRLLTDEEMEWAKVAWVYFENNYHEDTALVNSADKYPASTMWDTSSYLLGLISASRLGIVEEEEFEKRVSGLLTTLATMPLFDDVLPNKSYNTMSVAMVTYNNDVSERGIGWSAIDVGRLMVPLNVLVWNYPDYTGQVAAVLAHWKLDESVLNAEMYGTEVDEEDQTVLLQEGRLGYEEYAAKSLALIGKDMSNALSYTDNMELVDIYGYNIATDTRDPETFGALNYVVSEPYILDGIEYGWDQYSKELSARLFKAQQERFAKTGILTAVSEDNIDEAPYFVYNTVFAAGKAWNAITSKGEDASAFRTVSTKAAIGFYALYDEEYSEQLLDHVKTNYDAERGWYSGIYESSGEPNKSITANTNGIILEALHYIQFGPIMSQHMSMVPVVAEVVEE